jgi:hypothetical protein
MSLEDMFGPFARVFDAGELDVPGHLTLLRLNSPGAQVVIDRIAVALKIGDSQRWVTALLHDVNWRPHLVGAIALIIDRRIDARLLWDAIDRGSWVIPQLVVTAAHVDSRFRERARERVDAGCPIVVPSGLSPAERHSATGPEGGGERSAKMLASILAMSAELADLADWTARVKQDERAKTLLAVDASWNSSNRIVVSWLKALRAAFQTRGQTLNLIDRGTTSIAPAIDIDHEK